MKRRPALRFPVLVLVLLATTLSCSKRGADALLELGRRRLNPATLEFLWPGEEKKDFQAVMDVVARRSGLNARVSFTWCGYEYATRIRTAISSGQAFDAFCAGSPESGDFDYIEMARTGRMKDITELLSRYAPGIVRQLTPEVLAMTAIDGALFVVPSLYPQALGQGVAVRLDLMKRYGIDRIATLDDYGKYLKAVKEHEPGLVPGSIGFVSLELFARGFGYVVLDKGQNLVYRLDDPSMKVIPWEQAPEFRREVSYLATWHRNGYLLNPSAGAVREVASMLSEYAYEEGPVTASMGDRRYELYNYPLYPQMAIRRASPVGTMYLNGAVAFSAASRNVERTIMLLDWIQGDPKNYALFMYGLEGRHYAVKDGLPDIPEGISWESHPYLGWPNSPFRNLDLEAAFWGSSGAQQPIAAYRDFLRARTSYAPHEGFHPDYRDLREKADERAVLFRETFDWPLTKGAYDVASIDEDIAALKRAGADDIAREVQRQLALWRSRKS